MNPLLNVAACVLTAGLLVAHLWLASRVSTVKGAGLGVVALLVPCAGLVIGFRNLERMRAPTLAVLAGLLAFAALSAGAAQQLEARRQVLAARDAGIDDPDYGGFGD